MMEPTLLAFDKEGRYYGITTMHGNIGEIIPISVTEFTDTVQSWKGCVIIDASSEEQLNCPPYCNNDDVELHHYYQIDGGEKVYVD